MGTRSPMLGRDTTRCRITAATPRGISVLVTLVAATALLLGGSALWLIERDVPSRTVDSWGDSLWWALTTLTTVGYGDHIPVTTAGRLIAGALMVVGVAVLGGVAAVVALVVAQAVATAEEQELEAEAEAVEHRIEARLEALDARLARIEHRIQLLATSQADDAHSVPGRTAPHGERPDDGRHGAERDRPREATASGFDRFRV